MIAKIATPFTIASGGTLSNILNVHETISDAFIIGLTRQTVSADAAPTYTLEVTNDVAPTASGLWFTLVNVAGVSVTPPAVGKALTFQSPLAYTGLRIKASIAVTLDQVWNITKSNYNQ